VIVAPAGWRSHLVDDGRLLLYPVDGTPAVAEYREQVRPLADAAAVVDGLVARDPRFEATAIGEAEPLVTHEGEYAALVTVAGRIEGRLAQRDVGVLLADDYYACTDCITIDPARFADMTEVVRALVVDDTHALGLRRRRFRYRAPAGWHGDNDAAGATTWLPRTFPVDPAAITVWPALPHGGCPAGALESLVTQAGSSPWFRVEQVSSPRPLAAGHLDGSVWDLVGAGAGSRPARRTIALLQDDRYVYPARLDQTGERGADAHRDEFLAMVATTEMIPAARPRCVADAAAALVCWVD
jgi:hypothetical protein